jgi:hypothetical protein
MCIPGLDEPGGGRFSAEEPSSMTPPLGLHHSVRPGHHREQSGHRPELISAVDWRYGDTNRKLKYLGQVGKLMPLIPTMWGMEIGGLWFKVSSGEKHKTL